MARDDDEDVPWTRQLAVVVGVLVAVALVIGGVVSVVALGAAKVTGLGGSHASATAPPSLYFPSDDPTTTPETYPDPNGSDKPSPSPSSKSPSAKPTQKTREITLQAFPQNASPNERINLTGNYQGGEGARLQVQRYEGGSWVDFPVSTSVSGGAFATYIYTGRTGENRFRVLDQGSGEKSNAVRIRIG
jgi:hypothetical protein